MRIVIIISDSRHLFGLRKELIESWVSRGHEVIAIGDGSEKEFDAKCRKSGFSYRHVTLSRTGLNPLTDYRTLKELKALLKELQPDRVFCTFAKAVSYGCWAAGRANIKHIYALISGLGSVFRGNSLQERCIRIVMSRLYKNAFRYCDTVIFQNNDDATELVCQGLLPREKAYVVNGSGVDLKKFKHTPLPNTATFLFIGRLLREKGIKEYIEAAKIVKRKYPHAHFIAIGDTDSNPSSLRETDIEAYRREGIIDFVGYKEDVRPYIAEADVFVLPSYHEGTPRSVLEAMSMGRPIITTDAPGCRETVIDGLNGFLIPVGHAEELASKMNALLDNADLRERMAQQSRQIAEEKYDVNMVNADIADIMELEVTTTPASGFEPPYTLKEGLARTLEFEFVHPRTDDITFKTE